MDRDDVKNMAKKLSNGQKYCLIALLGNCFAFFANKTLGGFSSPAFWVFIGISGAIGFFLGQMFKTMGGDERSEKIHEKSLGRAFEVFGVSLLILNFGLVFTGWFVGDVAIFMWGVTVAFLVVIVLYTILSIYYYKKM